MPDGSAGLKPGMYVRLDWVDPTGGRSWTDGDDGDRPAECSSWGRIITVSRSHVVIAGTYSKTTGLNIDRTALPKGCILRWRAIPGPG